MAIYKLGREEKILESLEKTTFSAENLRERDDLQALLKEQINIIAPECLVISEEFSFSEWSESKRRIDLLAVNQDGNLVVIELKRDEVGAHMELQAIRYASMVSTLIFSEVVEIFVSFLSKKGDEHTKEQATQKLYDFFGSNFVEEDFGSDVSIILVSANFSKEVTTSVMWLNERNLDITCIRMIPYRSDKDLFIDVQQIIPLPEAEEYQIKLKNKNNERRKKRERSPEFESVISQITNDNPDLKIKGTALHYRQICLEGWPSKLHYELVHIKRGNRIGLELHLEDEKVIHLAPLLESYQGKMLMGYEIEWDEKWSSGKGRIRVKVPLSIEHSEISKMMMELISLTRDSVDRELKNVK